MGVRAFISLWAVYVCARGHQTLSMDLAPRQHSADRDPAASHGSAPRVIWLHLRVWAQESQRSECGPYCGPSFATLVKLLSPEP